MRKNNIQQNKKDTVLTDFFSNSKNSEGDAIYDIFFKRYCVLTLYYSVIMGNLCRNII